MFDGILKNMITDFARSALAALGAYLVSVGFFTSAEENEFVAGGLWWVAIVWAWYENRGHQQIVDLLKAHTGTGTLASAKSAATPYHVIGFLILASGLSLFSQDARAQMTAKAPVVAASRCTTAFCTGPYAGGGIDGNGTNADIIGSGLDQSVFGAGAYPTIDGGYQIWNGSWLLAAEASMAYSVPTSGDVTSSGWLATQEIQVGGTLSSILNSSSSPITIPGAISADLIAPYVALGVAEEKGGSAFDTGAGAKFAIGNNMMLDLGYRYLPFNTSSSVSGGTVALKADNLIRLRFDYVFK